MGGGGGERGGMGEREQRTRKKVRISDTFIHFNNSFIFVNKSHIDATYFVDSSNSP